MTTHIRPLSEVTARARSALFRELGVVDTLRFLHQFRSGSGDYTVERAQLFKGESVKSIAAALKAQSNHAQLEGAAPQQ